MTSALKITIMLIAILAALLVAVVTAWLKVSSGSRMQAAALTGGAAFGGTLTLILLALSMASDLQ